MLPGCASSKLYIRPYFGRSRSARLNPTDRGVEKIGAQIAVARALSDLAHKLLHSAAHEVEGMTHQRAHLHM